MDPIIQVALTIVLSLLLSAIAWKTGMLTADGAVAAGAVLLAIGIMGSLDWLLMLVIFAVLGFAVTKISFSKKKEKGLQEGTHGERTWKNILGVSLAPAIIAIANFIFPGYTDIMTVAYLGSIAVAASDTVASEIGVKDPRAWLITTFKRVDAGTNGGISVLGLSVSLVASTAVAILGWLVLFHDISWLLLIPLTVGMAGNLLDSFFGATIEDKFISKYTNNFITGLIGALLAAAIYVQF
ncbi:MAG TPA: DUF92 domain-containing protein [Candidatus Methanomethylophilaceae archaeon]|nr:DUF92 domain-containing protein [Candidatus Methanomethylophilaceae archaeon]